MELSKKITEFLLLLLLTSAIMFLSLSPSSAVAPAVRMVGGDKIAHFLAYSALGFWTFFSLGDVWSALRSRYLRRYVISVVYCVVIGTVLELVQPMFGRTTSVWDFTANTAGALFGTLAALLIIRAGLRRSAKRAGRKQSGGTSQ